MPGNIGEKMKDLIDRQEAIETLWEEPSYTDPLNVLAEARDRIKALPSHVHNITMGEIIASKNWAEDYMTKCGNNGNIINNMLKETFIAGFKKGVAEVKLKQKDSGWIPVTERLPENDDSVLVTHYQGVGKAWWNGRYWSNSMTKELKTVSAWMPLPEPYQEKKEVD